MTAHTDHGRRTSRASRTEQRFEQRDSTRRADFQLVDRNAERTGALERRAPEGPTVASAITAPPIAVCLALSRAISRARTLDDIYQAALDALARGLAVSRASILLFDPDNVLRFKASRGLSEAYRTAVEGHSPWTPDSLDPHPIVVDDVTREPSLAPLLQTIVDEGIAGMAFIPLVSVGRVIGSS